MLSVPPTVVLANYLKNKGELWPTYVDQLPATPDNAICLYDNLGVKDGRIMKTGEVIIHPGIQFRVRGIDYLTAWKRMSLWVNDFSTVSRVLVNCEGKSFTIHAIKQVGNPIIIQPEENTTRRNLTLNLLVTIKEN